MKTITLLVLLLFIPLTTVFAQETVPFNKQGQAVLQTTLSSQSSTTYTFSSKDFKTLTITQTQGRPLAYTLKYNGKTQAQGTTSKKGFNVKNTAKGNYILTLKNLSKQEISTILSITAEGGFNDI